MSHPNPLHDVENSYPDDFIDEEVDLELLNDLIRRYPSEAARAVGTHIIANGPSPRVQKELDEEAARFEEVLA